LREIAKLKSGRGLADSTDGGSTAGLHLTPVSASEAALKTVGNLRLYEISLGIFFIILIFNWTLFPNN
jgi:hypothetical protein